MRIGAHADAANGTHSVSPSVSLSLPLISKTARELSHTLQVAGSEGGMVGGPRSFGDAFATLVVPPHPS